MGFAREINSGEEVLEAEDAQPQRTTQSPELPPRPVIDEHNIDHYPIVPCVTLALKASVVKEIIAVQTRLAELPL